ncbi:MAG: hypothetical protein AMXMBFR83_14100 [Phycisphaerae bacterium]
MDLIITIDTEADNQWARSPTLTTRNTRFIPRFQALCDRFGFRPTYLCTYEMVVDGEFQATVRPWQDSGRAEIGAHLHPWSNPPFEPWEERGHEQHPFPHELPLDLFERKMAVLTDAIGEAFGRAPTSYRAGRYGLDAPHVEVLCRLGYEVDCSVTPYCSWSHAGGRPGGRGGMDFRRARPMPYRLSRDDCTRAGDSALWEVPVTILFTKWPLRSSEALRRLFVSAASPRLSHGLARRGWGPRWFRPHGTVSAADLLCVYDTAERIGLPCAEMIFHSSELMPGGSPYFPDEASIERLYETLEAVFAGLAARGARGARLTDFARGHFGAMRS